MAYIWNANCSSFPLRWTHLLRSWGSATQNRSVKRPVMREAVAWWNSLLQAVVNSQSWICFRKQLNTLVKGKFTSIMRCRYCLCLRIPQLQPEGWGGMCMAVCIHPLPPHPWVKAGCWTKHGSFRPWRGLVLLWFWSPSADNQRSCGGRSTELFPVEEGSHPPPAS